MVSRVDAEALWKPDHDRLNMGRGAGQTSDLVAPACGTGGPCGLSSNGLTLRTAYEQVLAASAAGGQAKKGVPSRWMRGGPTRRQSGDTSVQGPHGAGASS